MYYTVARQNRELENGFLLATLGMSEKGRLICQFANEKRVIQKLKNARKW